MSNPCNTGTSHNVTIVSLTEPGKHVALRVQRQLPSHITSFHRHKPKPFGKVVTDAFLSNHRMIFICSTGIVIRTLAPVLAHKTEDPAVLVIDQDAKHVVSLLSGHEGGANEWAREIASGLQATPVITSAEQYTRPVYTLGIGCDRGCPEAHIAQLVDECITQLNNKYPDFSADAIRSIASIDLKADETGLLNFCAHQGRELQVYPASALRTVEDQLSYKSDIVFKEVGCYGVAEAAALIAASTHTNNAAELVLEKQKSTRATCAVARSYQ